MWGLVEGRSAGEMDYAASFFEGRGSQWNYNSLKNFNAISTAVQHHLQRVKGFAQLGWCVFGCCDEGFVVIVWIIASLPLVGCEFGRVPVEWVFCDTMLISC